MALLLVLAAAACIPNIRRPEVDLVAVRLGGLGIEGGLLYVDLSVINPNPFGLGADGLTYDIQLDDPGRGGDDWVRVASGTFEEDFGVAANDSTIVTIPVEFTYGGVGALVRSVLGTGAFNYRVSGVVALEDPLGTEIPYRRTGTVAVLEGD